MTCTVFMLARGAVFVWLLQELLVFGSEKKRLCLVLKGTLVTNLSTIENKTCGRVLYHFWMRMPSVA